MDGAPTGVRPRSSARSLWLLLAAAGCALAVASTAPAVDRALSASTKPTVRVAPSVVKRGQAITVTGSHWPKRVTVQLLIGPPQAGAERFGSARTTSRGTFSRKLVLPAWVQARLGRWVVLGCRRDCRVKATASFRLTR